MYILYNGGNDRYLNKYLPLPICSSTCTMYMLNLFTGGIVLRRICRVGTYRELDVTK